MIGNSPNLPYEQFLRVRKHWSIIRKNIMRRLYLSNTMQPYTNYEFERGLCCKPVNVCAETRARKNLLWSCHGNVHHFEHPRLSVCCLVDISFRLEHKIAVKQYFTSTNEQHQ